jgi:heme/copper-type cytochrome/quinol oxidase subunit 2
MRATVVVEEQAAFDRWAARQKSGEGPRPGGVAPQTGGQAAGDASQQTPVVPGGAN